MYGSQSNPVLRGNILRDNFMYGISVFMGAKALIVDNLCERNKSSGICINFPGSSAEVRANHCVKNAKAGITFYPETQGIARDNVCDENGEDGIWLDGGVRLEGNFCRRNKNVGILVAGGSNVSLADNHCEENQRSGIHILGGSPSLARNVLTGNADWGLLYNNGATPQFIVANLFAKNGKGDQNPDTKPAK